MGPLEEQVPRNRRLGFPGLNIGSVSTGTAMTASADRRLVMNQHRAGDVVVKSFVLAVQHHADHTHRIDARKHVDDSNQIASDCLDRRNRRPDSLMTRIPAIRLPGGLEK